MSHEWSSHESEGSHVSWGGVNIRDILSIMGFHTPFVTLVDQKKWYIFNLETKTDADTLKNNVQLKPIGWHFVVLNPILEENEGV